MPQTQANYFSDANEHPVVCPLSVSPVARSDSSLPGFVQSRLLSLLAKRGPCHSAFWLPDVDASSGFQKQKLQEAAICRLYRGKPDPRVISGKGQNAWRKIMVYGFFFFFFTCALTSL